MRGIAPALRTHAALTASPGGRIRALTNALSHTPTLIHLSLCDPIKVLQASSPGATQPDDGLVNAPANGTSEPTFEFQQVA